MIPDSSSGRARMKDILLYHVLRSWHLWIELPRRIVVLSANDIWNSHNVLRSKLKSCFCHTLYRNIEPGRKMYHLHVRHRWFLSSFSRVMSFPLPSGLDNILIQSPLALFKILPLCQKNPCAPQHLLKMCQFKAWNRVGEREIFPSFIRLQIVKKGGNMWVAWKCHPWVRPRECEVPPPLTPCTGGGRGWTTKPFASCLAESLSWMEWSTC